MYLTHTYYCIRMSGDPIVTCTVCDGGGIHVHRYVYSTQYVCTGTRTGTAVL